MEQKSLSDLLTSRRILDGVVRLRAMNDYELMLEGDQRPAEIETIQMKAQCLIELRLAHRHSNSALNLWGLMTVIGLIKCGLSAHSVDIAHNGGGLGM